MKFRRNVKGDLPFLIVLFVLLFLLPHIAMSIPGFPHHPIEAWYQETVGEDRDMVFGWVALWSAVPFFSLAAALFRVLYDRPFSLLLPGEVLVISLTYLPRWPVLAPALALLALPLLAMEGFNALRDRGAEKGGKLLAGAAANYKFLALVFFWSAGGVFCLQITNLLLLLVDQISYGVLLFLTLPVILAVLPLFQLEDRPLTAGGAAGLGLLLALSLVIHLLGALLRSSYRWADLYFLPFYLGSLAVSFSLLFLVEGIIWLVRRAKDRRKDAGQHGA